MRSGAAPCASRRPAASASAILSAGAFSDACACIRRRTAAWAAGTPCPAASPGPDRSRRRDPSATDPPRRPGRRPPRPAFPAAAPSRRQTSASRATASAEPTFRFALMARRRSGSAVKRFSSSTRASAGSAAVDRTVVVDRARGLEHDRVVCVGDESTRPPDCATGGARRWRRCARRARDSTRARQARLRRRFATARGCRRDADRRPRRRWRPASRRSAPPPACRRSGRAPRRRRNARAARCRQAAERASRPACAYRRSPIIFAACARISASASVRKGARSAACCAPPLAVRASCATPQTPWMRASWFAGSLAAASERLHVAAPDQLELRLLTDAHVGVPQQRREIGRRNACRSSRR